MNRNRRRRKSTSAAVYVSVAALAIVFLSIFGISTFMRVMYIEVTGASIYTDDEIVLASGISPGSNLLFLNAGAAAQRISGAMPYISEIKISRVMPAAVRIEVTESLALAAISYQGGILVIDSGGRILQRTDTVPSGLIEIRGFIPVDPETGSVLKTELGGEMRLRHLTDILEAMEKTGIYNDVSYIDVESIANISFGYAGRFKVILGSSSSALHKLSRLPGSIDTIDETRSPDETGVIDMSDPSGEWRFTPDR